MEISGDLLNDHDKERYDKWLSESDVADIREDAALPPNGFRTEGDVLYLACALYKRAFGKRGFQFDKPRKAE